MVSSASSCRHSGLNQAVIRLSPPDIEESDIEAVAQVLRSRWLVNGPQVRAFEQEVAQLLGAAYAVATSSGTSALTLALEALAIGPGHEVIVPSFTYPATAHAVVLVGAVPVFADVEENSWNLDASRLAAHLTPNTRAVLAVDQFGVPADRQALRQALADASRSDVQLIEDAACSLGAEIDGRPCGAQATAACFSFHPRKVITTGEGGLVVTDCEEVAQRIRQRRNHGRDAEGHFVESAPNLRMSELAGALGRSQLRRLRPLIARRRGLAEHYRRRLGAARGLSLQGQPPGAVATYQTFALRLAADYSRAEVVSRLVERQVEATVGSFAVHQLRPYCESGTASLPVSEVLAQQTLALPLHPAMTPDDVERVCDALDASLRVC